MSKRPATDDELMPPPGSSVRVPASYLPCKTFQGPRPGYFFRLGDTGPGYYVDRVARDAATRAMPPPPKRRKNAQELLADAEAEAGFTAGGGSGRGTESNAFADDSTVLDETGLRKLVLQFERRYAANQQLRLKHPHSPEKFVDSEVDLEVVPEVVPEVIEPASLFIRAEVS